MISNHEQLRAELMSHGHRFSGDTDTETIAALFLHYHTTLTASGINPSLHDLATIVICRIIGQFSVLVKSKLYPNEIIGMKFKSPLVLGLSFPEKDDGVTDESPTHVADVIDPSFLESEIRPSPSDSSEDGSEPVNNNNTDDIARRHSRSGVYVYKSTGIKPIPTTETARYYFSSDTMALTPFTTKVTHLEDGDIVHIRASGKFRISHCPLHRIEQLRVRLGLAPAPTSQCTNTSTPPELSLSRQFMDLGQTMDEIKKGAFSTFMEKEIFEQPTSVKSTLFARMDQDTRTVKLGGIAQYMDRIVKCRRVVFLGCGTSYNAGRMAEPVFQRLNRLGTTCVLASHFADLSPPISDEEMYVFISQSGSTADTIRALDHCKAHNAMTVGVVNTVGSEIYRQTTCGVHINAGYEASVCSTKAYTSQCVSLLMIALAIHTVHAEQQGVPVSEMYNELFDAVCSLPDYLVSTLEAAPSVRAICGPLVDHPSALVLGRGLNYATAMEGALKIKEVSYIHAEGLAAGELKHGPLALVTDDMLLVVVAPKDRHWGQMKAAVAQCIARRTDGGSGAVVIISDETDWADGRGQVVAVPHVHELIQPLINAVPLQLMALYIGEARGLDVDRPRNLAKSVTVE